MALTDNLISYWKLDEASGNALDAHGSNDLTDNNTVGSATGKISNARDFESTNNEYFSLADNADVSIGDNDFTFTAWVQLESTGSNRIIVAKTDSGNGEYFLYYQSSSNQFRFELFSSIAFGGGTGINATTFGSPSTATWYFIAARHDATANTISISVNNGTVDSTSHSGGAYDGTTSFTMGGDNFGQYWDGLIDEVGFWKRALSDAEITDLYNSGNGLAYPFSSNVTVTPTTLALVLTTYAPTVSTPVVCTPTTVALTLTTFAPTVSTPVLCTPAALAIVTTGYEPSVNIGYTITPGTLALTLTTFAPTVSTPVTCTPTTAALTITTYAPVIDDGSGPYSSVVSIVTRF